MQSRSWKAVTPLSAGPQLPPLVSLGRVTPVSHAGPRSCVRLWSGNDRAGINHLAVVTSHCCFGLSKGYPGRESNTCTQQQCFHPRFSVLKCFFFFLFLWDLARPAGNREARAGGRTATSAASAPTASGSGVRWGARRSGRTYTCGTGKASISAASPGRPTTTPPNPKRYMCPCRWSGVAWRGPSPEVWLPHGCVCEVVVVRCCTCRHTAVAASPRWSR